MWDLSPLTRDPACVPLHWKADFKPLDHQGSPKIITIIFFLIWTTFKVFIVVLLFHVLVFRL